MRFNHVPPASVARKVWFAVRKTPLRKRFAGVPGLAMAACIFVILHAVYSPSDSWGDVALVVIVNLAWQSILTLGTWQMFTSRHAHDPSAYAEWVRP